MRDKISRDLRKTQACRIKGTKSLFLSCLVLMLKRVLAEHMGETLNKYGAYISNLHKSRID